MTKKVNPPLSYRVPILPTLAAVGLGLLALPACSKSGQEAYAQEKARPVVEEYNPDVGSPPSGAMRPPKIEEERAPTRPTSGVLRPIEPVEVRIQGDVSMVPLDERPPEVLQPVPSGGEEADMDAEKPTVLQPEEPPIYRTAGVPLPPTEPEEEVVVPVEEEAPRHRTPGVVAPPPKVRPEEPPTVRLRGDLPPPHGWNDK